MNIKTMGNNVLHKGETTKINELLALELINDLLKIIEKLYK